MSDASARPLKRLALVTGGHGFLGSHLVPLLLAAGWRVRCLLRPERDVSVFQGSDVEVARGDLRSDAGLAKAVQDVDSVFHVAGRIAAPSPSEFDAVNVAGTARIARAVARFAPGCRRFLLVSSQAAAGPSLDGRPIDESAPPRPVSHYGRSKLRGELALRAALPDNAWTIVRPPAIYGPRDQAILPFFQLGARGFAPGLDGRGRRFNLLHARDVAAGLLAAATAPPAAGRVYFLADADGCSYADLAGVLARVFARRIRKIPLPDVLLDLAGALVDEIAGLAGQVPVFGREKARELKARWWLASAAAAQRDLGWEPRIELDEGFSETARWYEEHGLLG